MLVKIGQEVINLKHVRSVSQDEDNSKVINLSLMSDYNYDFKSSLKEIQELLFKAGLQTVNLSDTDIIVLDNVLSLSPDGDEITVLYKDGSDEVFYGTRKLEEIVLNLPVLTESLEDEEEDEVISADDLSDLQEEEEESSTAKGVQIFLALVFLAVFVYMALYAKH